MTSQAAEIAAARAELAALRRRFEDERRAREAAERMLAERSAALDRAFDGVALTDAEGRFVYMNDAHARMFGDAAGVEWLGRSWKELYAPAEAAFFEATVFPKLIESGGWRGEVAGRRRDGGAVYQEVTLSFLETGLLCVTRDIGERRALEQERRRLTERLLGAQALATLGRFAAILSHDFSAIIGAARHSAEAIGRAGPDAAAARPSALANLRASLDRAQGLTERLLSIGRPEPRASADVDLSDILSETFDLVFASSDAVSRLDAPQSGARLQGDRVQLEQLCANLLCNAEQACRDGRCEVRVSVARCADPAAWRALERSIWPYGPEGGVREHGFGGDVGPFWAVFVLDCGGGMSEAALARLFEPFYSTKLAEGGGHGLGLLSIETCLEAHGGRIRYRSAEGFGTLASALLPMAPPCAGWAVEMDGAAPVIVVDDDPAALQALCAALSGAGLSPRGFTDPETAVLAVLSDAAALGLVTDCALGAADGADLALAASRARPERPVILVSSSDETLRASTAAAAGAACGAFAKPITPADAARIAEIVTKRPSST